MKRTQKVLLIVLLSLTVIFFFLSANKGIILEQVLPDDVPAEVIEKIIDLPSDVSLGDLCSGKADCLLFCKDNSDACMDFCMENPTNEVCVAFEPEDFEGVALE
jgi:hypothetical protein|tara:strand:- start:456 stop:767 length:312 start_codon:yes stop_codon:yes gene_type:complete